jgi:hypothetical protein
VGWIVRRHRQVEETRPLLGRLSPGWSLSNRLQENPSGARAFSSDRR